VRSSSPAAADSRSIILLFHFVCCRDSVESLYAFTCCFEKVWREKFSLASSRGAGRRSIPLSAMRCYFSERLSRKVNIPDHDAFRLCLLSFRLAAAGKMKKYFNGDINIFLRARSRKKGR
jgi:hypothetical protein